MATRNNDLTPDPLVNDSTDPVLDEELETLEDDQEGETEESENSLSPNPTDSDSSQFFDDFFSGLTGEPNNDSAPLAEIDTPEEIEPIEQLKLYLHSFDASLQDFLKVVATVPEGLAPNELYQCFGREIKNYFFQYPKVYRFFISSHSSSFAFYSQTDNRIGILIRLEEQAEQQKQLAIDELNAEIAVDLRLASHHELLVRQEVLSSAIEELRN